MSKQHNTLRSFQDIDVSRFRKTENRDAPGVAAKQPPAPKREPDPADESALFLAAVAGNVDASLKDIPDSPVSANIRRRVAVKNNPDARGAENAPEQTAPRAPLPASEDVRLFARAMDGVKPVTARGRDLAPPSKPLPSSGESGMPDMEDFFSGKLEFSLEYTDEFVQGYILGLDPAVFVKLKAGAYSLEGHVDLHGQNMEQAYGTLSTFIKHAYQSGKRHLLVITGRGKNSPGGTPVLRERVQAWFTRDPFKRVILAFCTARPGDGGAGAVYVLLRKRKKHQGKIVWGGKLSEEELLL